MPSQDVWTNFTTITTTYNTGNIAEYNVVAADKYNQTNESTGFTDGNFEVWGRRFFTTGDAEAAGAGNVAFYPAAGYRLGYDGHVYNVGWGCYAWSASPYSATSLYGGGLNTFASWVSPVYNTYRSHAFPVRCVQD